MKECRSLAHKRWDCKYHIVFIPKRRKKKLFGVLRRHLGKVFENWHNTRSRRWWKGI